MSGTARARRWTGWTTRKPSVVRPFPVLGMELLEDRVTPAKTFTWTGLGGDTNWSTAANWTGAPGSPAGDPTDPEDLVFPAGVNAALRTARNDIANGVFNSISFGDGGYVLIGNPLTLGEAGVLGSGFIVANAGPTTATDNIQLNITLGVSTLANPVPSVQTFTVQSTADLTISGRLNGIGVSTLTKDGPGTLTLAGNNTGLAGPVKVADNAGALIVTNATALGSSAAPTTVGVNASLALGTTGAGLTYNEPLILNGPGTTGLGALWNLGGTNTWAGTISLDSNASIGARSGSTLIVTGVISDTAGGRDLTKSDQGEVRFDSPTGNTYRGLTTIEDGVLSIGHPLALGAPNVLGNNDVPSAANGTVVKSTLTGQGQLRVGDAFGSGFTVRDEFLTLNGAGRDGRGSLFNQAGDNQWAGPITLGSSTNTNATSVTVGAVTGSNLLVSGIVHDRPTNPPTVLPFPLIKGAAAPTGSPTEQGRVILNNNNASGTFATAYAGGTTVNQGFLTARDSGALGTGLVLVNAGAALELEVEFPLGNSASPNAPRFDPHGRDLWADSVTNDPNRLAVANNITINGPGQGTTNTGALHSISGINVTTGTLKVFNSASVGVDLDSRAGAPSQDRGYFTNDYSLTVNVLINEPPPLAGVGPIQANLTKRGAGQLILPNANTGFYSQTLIEQGWVTIRNNRSLGATDNVTDVLNPVNNTNEPVVTVSNGAALHLLPFPNQNLTIAQYISLTGNGTASPAYAFIKQKGALLSLDGNNLWTGDITLNGDAGIGVEQTQTYAGAFSELTVGPGNGTGPGTGTVQDGAAKGGLTKFGSKRLVLQGDGTYSGNNLIKEGTLRAQNDTALGQATSGTFTTQESYNQTDTNVAAGSVLELATSLPRLNGGIATGLEVWAERLILNAPAQQVAIAGLASAGGTFALTYASDTTGNTETSGPLPLTTNAAQLAAVLNDATKFPNLLAQVGSVSVGQTGNVFTVRYGTARTADVKLANLVWSATTGAEVTATGGNAGITTLSNTTAATPVYSPTANVADDHTWRGPVTLADSARVNVAGGTRLALLGAIDDATNLNPLGSDLIKRGPSELVLGGSSTFRGQTRIDTGIVTAVNGGAFGAGGSVPGGTFVQPGAQVQLQGTVTVAGEYLDVQGAGWAQNQVLDLGGTGGTFTLSLLGKTTAAIPYSATAAQVQAALTAAPFNTVIATPPEIQTVQVTGTAGTFALSYPGAGTTAALNVGSTAAAVQAALNTAGVLPAGATATVSSVTLGLTTTYTVVFGGTLATANANPLTVAATGGLFTFADTTLQGGGAAGTVTVANDPTAVPAGSRLIVTFGGGLASATIPQMTVANVGASAAAASLGTNPSTPTRMLNAGPGPINNGQSPLNRPTSGRVTGVATDPADPNTIYIATAGGGAWKTKNGGLSWTPMFDAPASNGQMYGGSIAIAPTNPRVLYYATGESNGFPNGNPIQGPADNFAGTGVYRSTDAGQTWTLLSTPAALQDANHPANPVAGQSISKLVVDPNNANRVYVATSNINVINTITATATQAGVWRFDANGWYNVVDPGTPVAGNTHVSPARRLRGQTGSQDGQAPFDFQAGSPPTPPPTPGTVGGGAPGVGGPDDDYRIMFPNPATTKSTWSDLYIGPTGALFAALSDTTERLFFNPGTAGQPYQLAVRKGVYWSSNPTSDTPSWQIGPGTSNGIGVDKRNNNNFPTGTLTNPTGPVGYIKLAGSGNPVPLQPGGIAVTTVYAAVTDALTDNLTLINGGSGIYRTQYSVGVPPAPFLPDTANGWTQMSSVPANALGTAAPFLGHYNLTMTALDNTTTVYLGGLNTLFRSTDAGLTWAPVSPDATGAAPAAQLHALALDANRNVVSGSDGGVWRFNVGTSRFDDLNGANLSITQLNSADPYPTDIGRAIAGAADNGVLMFGSNGTSPPAWTMVDPPAGSSVPTSAGVVRFNPRTPTVGYAVRDQALFQTTNGGQTWTQIANFTGVAPTATTNTFPLVLDSVDLNRVLIGGFGLRESNDAGANFVLLNGAITPTAIGIATYQGPFKADPGFPGVTDILANTYDANTIYVTDGQQVLVTKNRGVNWVQRNPANAVAYTYQITFGGAFSGTAANANVSQLVELTGLGTVTTLTQGNGTPTVPPPPAAEVQQLVVTGTNGGSFQLRFTAPNGTTATTGLLPVGASAAQVQNALNALTSIGGFGGSVSVSPPTVTGMQFGDIAVDPGNRDVAYLTTIQAAGTGPRVWRTTDAGQTWTNITGNLPDVPTRKVVVDPRSGTVYVGDDRGLFSLANAQTATAFNWKFVSLEQPVVQVRDLVLNQQFNTLTVASYGRGMEQIILGDYLPSSGALRGVSGSSVWTGPVTLSGDTAFGVAGTQQLQNGIASASVNVIGPISDATPGANYTVTKIGLGTLTFSGNNTYGGLTQVREGVLQVNNPHALGGDPAVVGDAGLGTVVTEGAALELRSDLQAETVTLNGNGIKYPDGAGGFTGFNGHFTGALRNVANNNTFTGTVVFGASTTNRITIGVDTGTKLTIGTSPTLAGPGIINSNGTGVTLTLDKELTGTLILASNNQPTPTNPSGLSGPVRVVQGALQVQDAGALGVGGSPATGTLVLDGAQVQISRKRGTAAGLAVADEWLTLNGTGINQTGALLNVREDGSPAGTNNNAWNGPVFLTTANPNFSPATTPPAQIGMGVSLLADTLTVNGVISQSPVGTPRGIIKYGPGRLTLTAANTYSGFTTVDAGTLQARNNAALGTSAGAADGTSVLNGATLELDGSGGALAVAENLTLLGNGVATAGALSNVAGNNAYNGPVTLATDPSAGVFEDGIGAAAGTTLTVNGAVQDPATIPVPAAQLRKLGTGAVVFPNAKTYGGATVVAAGTLRVQNAQSLGVGRSEQQQLEVIGLSGTFSLTFNGSTTSQLQFDVSAANIQAALQSLTSIGGGNVTVTPISLSAGNNKFLVAFSGTLANADQPTITVPPPPSGSAVTGIVTVARDGSKGTTVLSGATLELNGGISLTGEPLTISGPGFNDQGALLGSGGSNAISAVSTVNAAGAVVPIPVTLAASSSAGTTLAGDSLTFLTPISDGGAGRNVDVVGPGTVNYRANVSNAYTGTTTVQNGTLVLNQTAGTTAILGPLVIGDITGAAGSAVVTYPGTPGGADEMIANAVPVTINPDGQLNLAGHVETIGTLTITNGSATTGPGGRLSVTGLTMTGGSITLGTPGFPGQLVLNGNVTTSTAGSTAPRINGPGTISLAGSDRTVAVNDGTPTDDLVITAALATAGGGRLIKTGSGRLTFESVGASNVPVRVQTGDVQVGDFTVPAANIGPVQLAGGSLSGTGTVDALTDAAGGTVSPGIGGPGILRSGAITWAATTTFNVNVAAANRPPVAGTDYDQLQATGDVFLNGATLTGSLGAGVVVGDRFVILTTTGGTIQGTFAEPLGPGKVFIGGLKFDVDYSNPNQVSLVRALANATVSLASSANPATNNQPVVITATVVPETGVAVPTSGSVTFTVQRTAPTAATFQISKTVNASGQAFLLSSDFPAGFFSGLPSTGTFTVSAKYGDGSVAFNDTPDATLTPDEVVEVPVIGGLTVTVPPGGATPLIISPQNPTSTGVQDIAVVTATVGQERAATPTPPTWAVTITNGVNTRVITGTAVITGNSFPISATWNGRDNANAVVPDGSYNVTAAFSDQYGNTGSTTIANALVVDNTSPQLSGLTNSQPVIAPGTNSTVPTSTTIATTITEPHLAGWTLTVKKGNGPAVATQTGTGAAVNFTWYGTLNNVPGAAALTDGDYTATLVVTDTAGNSTTASTTVTVLTQAPTVTLRSNSPTLYGEGITLTATISAASALSNLLVGNSIDFYQAGNPTPVRTGTITQVAGRYQATVTLTSPVYTATGSPYQFTAAYAGSTNFLPSTSTPINHTVNPVQLTVFADDLSKVYGDAIPAPTFSTDGLQFADTPASVLTGSLSVSPVVSQSSPVGVYQNVINQGTLALANPNYTLAFVDGSLTVTPATLTVKANPITKGYGQPVPTLTYTATGFVLGESQSVLTGALGLATPVTAASPIGIYPNEITKGTLAASNYTIAFTSADLTVVPATLTVAANSISKLYGAPVPALTYTVSGLAAGDTPASVLTGSLALQSGLGQSTGVGTFAGGVTQGTLQLTSSNYTLAFNPGNFTVTPALLTIAANNQTKVYGDPVGNLTYVITSGLTNGDTPAAVTGTPGLATPVGPTSPAGVYPNEITRGTLAAGPNYTVAFTNGTMTVTAAPLTVTANAATKVYGDAVPALTYSVTGLKNGDQASSVLAGALQMNPAADQTSPVGTYPIIQGTVRVVSQNYTLTRFNGASLTVAPAPLTLAVADATRRFNDPNPPFGVSYSGFKLNDTAAVVSGVTLGTPTVPQNAAPGTYVDAITAGTPTAANYAITVDAGTLTILPLPPDAAFGSGAGAPARVNVYTPEGNFRQTIYPTDPRFSDQTGIRVAAADFNADGVTDVAMGTGPGAITLVTVIDGRTKRELFRVQPFESSFTGGVFVASGDVDGDGRPDLVVTPDQGGGPRVQLYRGTDFQKVADFLGIDDPNFRGGARAAVGDVNADGFGDVVVAAGFGGGPRVSILDGKALTQSRQFVHPVNDFFIFDGSDAVNLRNGAFVAAGDVNGDGYADLAAGGGPGGGPRVFVVDGKQLLQGNGLVPLANFFAGDTESRGGIRVAMKDFDGDQKADLIVGAGDNAGSQVVWYKATDLNPANDPPATYVFNAFDDVLNGVFVG